MAVAAAADVTCLSALLFSFSPVCISIHVRIGIAYM